MGKKPKFSIEERKAARVYFNVYGPLTKTMEQKLLLIYSMVTENKLPPADSIPDVQLSLKEYEARHLASVIESFSFKRYQGRSVEEILKKVSLYDIQSDIRFSKGAIIEQYEKLIHQALEELTPGINEETLSSLEYKKKTQKLVSAYRKMFTKKQKVTNVLIKG